MYVPSEQAPLPPASQFAAISSGIFGVRLQLVEQPLHLSDESPPW